MRRVLSLVLVSLASGAATSYGQAMASPASSGQQVALDRVVAVVNGQVLLQSDVDAEMSFAALEPGEGGDTARKAMSRLVDRVLILQQMNEQQVVPKISDADLEKSLMEQRTHLSDCGNYSCTSEQGWEAFLKAHDLTNQEVVEHWRERLEILRFIDQRYRSGIRISPASIADYYAKSVVPAFAQQDKTAPPLKSLAARIQEVLLQQQVNGMTQSWLNGLRQEGNLRVVDPEYASAVKEGSGSRAGEE